MTETIYTLYPVFAATPELRDRFADEKDRARAVGELLARICLTSGFSAPPRSIK